ncbi:MAG TPA: antitoxin AF2212-like protein [Tepidisphaeraceae bacterium]|nr:antitoxin AF2212-like protein [Tepidisphaeraceae bacterium]
MTRTIKAVFEHGIFRPVEPIALAEGQSVDIKVPEERTYPSPQVLLQALLEIAAIPESPPGDGLTAEDHDQVLYTGLGGT